MQFSRRTWMSLGLAAGLSLGLVGCFGGGGPEGVVREFYGAVAKGDAEQATKFIALKQVSANEMMMAKGKIQMMVGEGKARIEANDGLAKVDVLEQKLSEDGESAQLQVQVTYKNGKTSSSRMKMVKEEGGWKIRL